jgi:catechol 2,3-dioxygenase-like lactoylglutathione lyase family enzyme
MTSEFLGPIVSTNQLDTWERLLTQAFDMIEVARQDLAADSVLVLWGLEGYRAQTVLFTTPGTPYGIRLVALDPGSPHSIRDPKSGYDCDALKVIDFFTADFQAARDRLEAVGFKLKEEIAEYETDSGHITEGHLWGPDDVVCALVAGPTDFLSEFVTVTDQVVSEVHSVSAPVEDQAAVVRFYQSLGLAEVHRYEVTDESFQHLVGANDPLHIRAINMGSARHQPYLGVIHYGLPPGSYQSLAERSQLPHRGLAGATVRVTDAAAAAAACQQAGGTLLAEPREAELLPYGKIITAAVQAPHGVLHHLIQT